MEYKEMLWKLLDELFYLEGELWVCDEQRFNAGITENMIFDKQDEIAENIENIRLKYEAMLKDKMLKEEIKMDKRIYYAPREFKILADGNYNGYHYYITSLGTHPCCYIGIPENHRFYGLPHEEAYDINLDCHCGITFGGKIKGIDEYVIGWDYGHFGDFCYYGEGLCTLDICEHEYTLRELVHDCFKTIDDLVEMDKEYMEG